MEKLGTKQINNSLTRRYSEIMTMILVIVMSISIVGFVLILGGVLMNKDHDIGNDIKQLGKTRIRALQFQNLTELVSFNLKDPQKYTDIWKVTNHKQLPFCILALPKDKITTDLITQSLKLQNYSNYWLTFAEFKDPKINRYQHYKEIIDQKCPRNTLLLFIKGPLRQNTLKTLNNIHQEYYTWAIYSQDGDVYHLHSFYSRIFQLLKDNDFSKDNMPYLAQEEGIEVIAKGVLELCEYHAKMIDKNQVQMGSSLLEVNMADLNSSILITRTPYTRLYKLSQDFEVNPQEQQKRLATLRATQSAPAKRLTAQQMFKASQRLQILYLPANHSLFHLEQQDYLAKYNIQKYKDISNQVPFCLTILSHDNIAQNRYRKSILSAMQQEYENYHIVFIDDMSADDNVNQTIKVVQEKKFPKQRITFVENKQRRFATYNIINAAFNFCKPEDIQVLLDGDDELIGRHALSVLNAEYQRNRNKWIIYSNFRSNLNTYGTSQIMRNINMLVQRGKRRSNHFIGPIRTWRVQLLYSIPLAYHQNKTKGWLDTVYDDALQHSIVQLAGLNRVEYVPEILYEYNKQYGNNDDATIEKRIHRRESYQTILGLKPLGMLGTLNGAVKDKDIIRIFQQERDKVYFVREI